MYDTSKEEEWERMINPHNFDGGRGRSGYRWVVSRGAYRCGSNIFC
jgi:hypothetical protein